jgi:hypothetical protein
MRTETEIQREMNDYLPRYYGDIPIATNVIDREAAEIAQLNADIYDVLAQFFIESATWGMARWERIFGVTVDEAKPIDQRRAVIKSKLRGVGTVTPALIKSVAESYANGEVNVTEHNATYTVTITFVSMLGIPPNIADLETAIRDTLPAHLTVEYVFRYLTWNEITLAAKTWDAWDALGLSWDEMEVYKI